MSFRGAEQYHPLTVHWFNANKKVNWCRLRFKGSLLGKLEEISMDLTLKPDNDITTATLEFSHDIQLTGHTVTCNDLTMHLETNGELQADADRLTIDLPDGLDTHSVTISCLL